LTFYRPTEKDREKLKEPRGDVFEEKEFIEELKERDYSKIIAVGDRVSHDIVNSGLEPDLYVTDGKTEQEKFGKEIDLAADRTFEAENPAGKITEEAWKAMRKGSALKCKTHVEIEGEEDLMGLPAVLFAPEDAVVVYGLWDRGAVLMEPSKENKDFVRDLLGLEKSDHLIVGGSWDHFHSGHRYIILTAYEKGEKIDIGISSDEMLREKLGEKPENSFEERKNNVKSFLKGLGHKNFNSIELNGIYGNAVEEGETLLVTPETKKNGRKINLKREELGREKLELETVEKLKTLDGSIISSTEIRKGEIDENGLGR
jgi:cytidyltransferase-like protein